MARVDERIRKSQVRNPSAGTVLTTYVESGEVVQAGQPLYKIANLARVDLRAYVTETQLAQSSSAQQAQVHVDAGDGALRDAHRHDHVGLVAGRVHADADPDARRAGRSGLRDEDPRANNEGAQDRHAGRRSISWRRRAMTDAVAVQDIWQAIRRDARRSRGVSFDVAPGELFGFIGPDGGRQDDAVPDPDDAARAGRGQRTGARPRRRRAICGRSGSASATCPAASRSIPT